MKPTAAVATEPEFHMRPQGAFSLARTAARLRRFPEVVDHFEGGVYRRLMLVGAQPALISVDQEGPPSRARLRVRLEGREARAPLARAAAAQLLERALGATADLRSFYRDFADDPMLGPLIRRYRGLRVAGAPDVWEVLVTTVLSQQVNLSFAYSIRQALAETFGRRARFHGRSYIAFPTAKRMARESQARLLGFRLSRSKAATIARLADAFATGELSDAQLAGLPDDEAIERLTAIKGVGRWTAEVALLRGLARLDVFPGGDLGVVKYLAQGLLGHAEKASEQEMRRYAERWRPYRGLALIYAYARLAERR